MCWAPFVCQILCSVLSCLTLTVSWWRKLGAFYDSQFSDKENETQDKLQFLSQKHHNYVNKWCQDSVIIAIMDLDTMYCNGGHRKGTDSFILEKSYMRLHTQRRGTELGIEWYKIKRRREKQESERNRGRWCTRIRGERDTDTEESSSIMKCLKKYEL